MLELPRVALEAGVDWQTHARALRVYAESLGPIAETEGDVFHRFIEVPRLKAGLSQSEMIEAVNAIGVELAPGMEKLVLAVYPAPAGTGLDKRRRAAPGRRDRSDGPVFRPPSARAGPRRRRIKRSIGAVAQHLVDSLVGVAPGQLSAARCPGVVAGGVEPKRL